MRQTREDAPGLELLPYQDRNLPTKSESEGLARLAGAVNEREEMVLNNSLQTKYLFVSAGLLLVCLGMFFTLAMFDKTEAAIAILSAPAVLAVLAGFATFLGKRKAPK